MNRNLLHLIVRYSGTHCQYRRSVRPFTTIPLNWKAKKQLHVTSINWVAYRYQSSVSRKEVSTVVRLDSEGSGRFVYDNFGRLRVFLKFLALQSVPVALFAYCYCHFEKERQTLYSVPLESVDDALRHIWSITRNASCFLLVDGKAYMVNYQIGNKIDWEGVDSAETFLAKLQPEKRAMLKNIYISYSQDICIPKASDPVKVVSLLFYNQSLDSFACFKLDAVAIEDPEERKRLWTSKLGEATNKIALLSTKEVSIGFGGSQRTALLNIKEDWYVEQ